MTFIIHDPGKTTSLSNVHISIFTGNAIYAPYFLAWVILQETKEAGDFPWWDVEMPTVLILCFDSTKLMQLRCMEEAHEGHYYGVLSDLLLRCNSTTNLFHAAIIFMKYHLSQVQFSMESFLVTDGYCFVCQVGEHNLLVCWMDGGVTKHSNRD
jgi:hypothetical protein